MLRWPRGLRRFVVDRPSGVVDTSVIGSNSLGVNLYRCLGLGWIQLRELCRKEKKKAIKTNKRAEQKKPFSHTLFFPIYLFQDRRTNKADLFSFG